MNTDVGGELLRLMEPWRNGWYAYMLSAAEYLFVFLATWSFSWAFFNLLRRNPTMHDVLFFILYETVIYGSYYYLVQHGREMISAVLHTFEQWGGDASGLKGLSGGDLFNRGLNIAGALGNSTTLRSYVTDFGASIMIDLVSFLILISFVLLAFAYWAVTLDSMVALSVGVIFLGFSGASLTREYTFRFFSLVIGIGVRNMLLYFVSGGIGAFSDIMLTEAYRLQAGTTALAPMTTVLAIGGGGLLCVLSAFYLPKFFASIMGGTPHMTGGDIMGLVAGAAGTALSAGFMASMAARAATGAVSASRAASAAGSSGSGGTAAISGGADAGAAGGTESGGAAASANVPPVPPAPSGSGTATAGAARNGSARNGAATGMIVQRAVNGVRNIDHDDTPPPPPPPIRPNHED